MEKRLAVVAQRSCIENGGTFKYLTGISMKFVNNISRAWLWIP